MYLGILFTKCIVLYFSSDEAFNNDRDWFAHESGCDCANASEVFGWKRLWQRRESEHTDTRQTKGQRWFPLLWVSSVVMALSISACQPINTSDPSTLLTLPFYDPFPPFRLFCLSVQVE